MRSDCFRCVVERIVLAPPPRFFDLSGVDAVTVRTAVARCVFGAGLQVDGGDGAAAGFGRNTVIGATVT